MIPSRTRRPGFALPAVLAVTGVVTLIFLVAMTALNSLMAEAASARARVRFLTRAMTAEARLSYMASTEPTTSTGFNIGGTRLMYDSLAEPVGEVGEILKLDGRPYQLDIGAPMRVTLQDQAGMINIAYLSEDGHRRLGEDLGLPVATARRLGALYRDYTDQDDLKQVNGAEAADYDRGAPANRAMRRPDEWLSLPGVREGVRPGDWRRLRGDLAMDSTSPNQNVNTASPTTLRILYGATPEQAQAAIRERDEQPFYSFSTFAAATGLPDTSGDGFYTYPSGQVVMTLADSQSAWTYRARLALTPSGLERPVWIDQTELKEAPRRAKADLSNAVRLPYTPN